jgi:hypothetical protein
VRHPYVELPGETRLVRPALLVQLEGLSDVPYACLVDSGAVANRLPATLATRAGLPLEDALDEDRIAVAGLATTGWLLRVDVSVSGETLDLPVWFCDPWPWSFGLLGQEGFFRYFRVTFCAAEGWLEVVREAPPQPEPIGKTGSGL